MPGAVTAAGPVGIGTGDGLGVHPALGESSGPTAAGLCLSVRPCEAAGAAARRRSSRRHSSDRLSRACQSRRWASSACSGRPGLSSRCWCRPCRTCGSVSGPLMTSMMMLRTWRRSTGGGQAGGRGPPGAGGVRGPGSSLKSSAAGYGSTTVTGYLDPVPSAFQGPCRSPATLPAFPASP